ncbi:MAG: hypothetical protein LAP38_27145 [Acidobacteriia bacterium]|nr:hypothetical protein [Terriglobia bacterium]
MKLLPGVHLNLSRSG